MKESPESPMSAKHMVLGKTLAANA